jgi:hypothetical protein
VVAALALLAGAAQATPQFDVGLGLSAAELAPNGTWYQEGHPYTTKLNTPGAMLGFSDKFNDDWKWNAHYVHLGTKRGDALACDRDEHYSGTGDCGPVGNVARYLSAGSGNGLAFTAERTVGISGYAASRVRIGLEAGPYVYRPKNFVRVDGWNATPDSEPQTIYKINTRRYQVGYVVGVNVYLTDAWRVSARRYANRCLPSADACLWDATTAITLVYSF